MSVQFMSEESSQITSHAYQIKPLFMSMGYHNASHLLLPYDFKLNNRSLIYDLCAKNWYNEFFFFFYIIGLNFRYSCLFKYTPGFYTVM